jgi:hypothetical protein
LRRVPQEIEYLAPPRIGEGFKNKFVRSFP